MHITALSKVPQITLLFWVIKICATTLGETAGDLFSMTLQIGYGLSSLILIGMFLLTLGTQLLSKRYHPLLYWSVILLTSTAGTTMSDYIDRTLGLGYAQGSLILVTLLACIFLMWRWLGHSFSVAHIHEPRIEFLYWLAILFSNTLGTAFGDFLADDSGLGFARAALLIAATIAGLVAAHYYTRISGVILFWAAFVLTRPFGANLGDLLTKPPEKHGLDFGTAGTSAMLLGVLLALVIWQYLHIKTDKKVSRASN